MKTMRMTLMAALVAAGLLSASALQAQEQGFQAGRHFLELKGGIALNTDGDLASAASGLETGNFPIITLLAGTAEQQTLNLFLFSAQPETDLEGVGGEFLYEYAITDWFGLGAVIANDTYTFTNVPGPSSALATSFLPFAFIGGSSSSSSSSTSAGLLERAVQLETLGLVTAGDVAGPNIWTLNFHSTFHFVDRASWDPYFRIEIGGGQDTNLKLTAVRGSGVLGSRFFFGDTFYALAEVGYTYYSLSGGEEDEGGFTSSPTSETIGETSANIGFGFAL